jgi:hypothetical protein
VTWKSPGTGKFVLKPAGSSDCCADRLENFFGAGKEYLSISMQKNFSRGKEMHDKNVMQHA